MSMLIKYTETFLAFFFGGGDSEIQIKQCFQLPPFKNDPETL